MQVAFDASLSFRMGNGLLAANDNRPLSEPVRQLKLSLSWSAKRSLPRLAQRRVDTYGVPSADAGEGIGVREAATTGCARASTSKEGSEQPFLLFLRQYTPSVPVIVQGTHACALIEPTHRSDKIQRVQKRKVPRNTHYPSDTED